MRTRLLPAAGMLSALLAGPLAGQAMPMLESSSKAQVVLDRALEAYGGRDRVRAMSRQFTWVLDGELVHLNQSPSASRSVGTPFTMVLAGDLDAGRFRSDRTGSYPGGFNWRNIDVLDSGKTRAANIGLGTVVIIPGADVANYQAQLERLPQMVLARLDGQRRGLLWSGELTRDGQAYSVIEAPVNGTTIGRYYFLKSSGLLTDMERVIGDDYAGDALVRVRLTDYRTQGGTMVPGMIEQLIAGSPTMRVRPTTVLLAQAPAESLFTLPAGLTETQRQPPAEPAFDQVGPGVYLASGMAGGYRLLVADLGDHLAVVESPNGSEQSGRAIALINQQFPGKPIRYVVPTHHHDDHAGGLRAFIATGSIVVTTRGNEAVFRRMAAAPYTIEPDEQSRVKKPVQFAFVDKRMVLEGGGTRLELIDVGPSPHADEMLIAYVPASRFVFQGDLFNTGGNASANSWGNLTTVHFADWLSGSGLAVDSVAGTHSPVRTRAELDGAAARVKQTAAVP
jgi:glyoxylase-like metal-dependent hydrolase (beta-lactamase superfamily II)